MKKELRLGNFKITREKMSFDWIKIEAISGVWNTKFRSDNPFYPILDEMIKMEQAHTHLQNTIIMMYLVSNGLKDTKFIEDVFAALDAYISRTETRDTTEEENNKIIEEEREKYEANNEIQRGAEGMDTQPS